MKDDRTTIERLNGEIAFACHTRSNADAEEQLMMLTGQFLNMLDHVSRFHLEVVTPSYLHEVLEDLRVMGIQHGWPYPRPE